MKSLVTVYLLVTLLDQSLVINCDGDHHHDHGEAATDHFDEQENTLIIL